MGIVSKICSFGMKSFLKTFCEWLLQLRTDNHLSLWRKWLKICAWPNIGFISICSSCLRQFLIWRLLKSSTSQFIQATVRSDWLVFKYCHNVSVIAGSLSLLRNAWNAITVFYKLDWGTTRRLIMSIVSRDSGEVLRFMSRGTRINHSYSLTYKNVPFLPVLSKCLVSYRGPNAER
jgi:hypothetical protein